MKTMFTGLATLFCMALTTFTSHAALLSGPIDNPANGLTYYLLTSATWTASEAEAVGLGGHLVTINGAAENAWVYSTFGSFGGVGRGLWIGLTDRTTEGTFTWVSGETSAYRNWAPGEPNNANGTEDYVHVRAPFDDFPARWNDYSNLTGPFGVVEIVPVPEPSSWALLIIGASVLGYRRWTQRQ